MQEYEKKEYKDEAVERLKKVRISDYELSEIDERLDTYTRDVQRNGDGHNLYEILAVLKFFRLMDTYEFAPMPVKRIINLIEHGLEFSTQDGMRSLTLSPCQVFQFASIYGFYYKWVSPHDKSVTEMRRLVRQAIIFIPRKFGKTTEVVAIAVNSFLWGEANSQVYTLANTDRQALTCFKEIRTVLEHADTSGDLKFTAHNVRWSKNAFRTNDPNKRTSFIESLSGNPRTKDGLNAETFIYDEYGSAFYVKDHSDGAALLQVVESSMGTRKQPLGVIITTASRITNGPFQIMLEGAKQVLRGESDADWQFAHIFCPDAWEMEDESLSDPKVWAKVQPHLGVTVQPDYYAAYWEKAQLDPEAYVEFKTKLLNIFQEVAHTDWLSAEDIRKKTMNVSIDDLSIDDGWECYMGMDFSRGNDLNAQVYMCTRVVVDHDGNERREFLFDCDAWITEEQFLRATSNPLYKEWANAGHLRICKGAVIDEMGILRRVIEVTEKVNIIQIGYDKFDSERFINALDSWMYGMGANPKEVLKIVSQTFATFNSPVQGMEFLVKCSPDSGNTHPNVVFANNPLFAWCFGNCVLMEDSGGFENVKPVKRSQNQKIDIAICALMALQLFSADDNNRHLLNAGGR